MKQLLMFDGFSDKEKTYSSKVEAPIYTPSNIKPDPFELVDDYKTKRLIQEINDADIPDVDKLFLTKAAHRHTVFNYEKIADYYAQSCTQVQELMEKSGLVIVDFDKAIEYGYVKLCKDIETQYLEEYNAS